MFLLLLIFYFHSQPHKFFWNTHCKKQAKLKSESMSQNFLTFNLQHSICLHPSIPDTTSFHLCVCMFMHVYEFYSITSVTTTEPNGVSPLFKFCALKLAKCVTTDPWLMPAVPGIPRWSSIQRLAKPVSVCPSQ